jgi:hypothetical protein
MISHCLDQRFSNCGPQVVLEICPWGPTKQTEEKIQFKWIAYHTITENLRVWKLHMAIAFHFFSQYWHFIKFITLPNYRLPTLLSATKEGFKALWPWCFLPPFPCTSGAAPVTQPGTTRVDQSTETSFHVFMTILIVLHAPSLSCLHIEMVSHVLHQ